MKNLLFILILFCASISFGWPSWPGDVKFCPVCKLLGLKSVIIEGMTTSTAMGTISYFDEDGKYHYDNPNIYTTNYRCSLGHEWQESTRNGTTVVFITSSTTAKVAAVYPIEDVIITASIYSKIESVALSSETISSEIYVIGTRKWWQFWK
jgi:hypothetical protein